jgi:hypothetical protein
MTNDEERTVHDEPTVTGHPLRNALLFAGLLLFAGAAFYINSARHGDKPSRHHHEARSEKGCDACRKEEAKRTVKELRSIPYLERYIVEVINEGSSQGLGFKYGDMPARMADEKAAPKIAAYVVHLAGLKPTHPEWVKEGHTFYISNCGGCHGEDGRGIHGTFPDLTRVPLLGIEKRLRKAAALRNGT